MLSAGSPRLSTLDTDISHCRPCLFATQPDQLAEALSAVLVLAYELSHRASYVRCRGEEHTDRSVHIVDSDGLSRQPPEDAHCLCVRVVVGDAAVLSSASLTQGD